MSRKSINIDELFKDAVNGYEVKAPTRRSSVSKIGLTTVWKKSLIAFGSISLLWATVIVVFLQFKKEEKPVVKMAVPVVNTPINIPVNSADQFKLDAEDSVAITKSDISLQPNKEINASTPIINKIAQPKEEGEVTVITEKTTYYQKYEVDANGNKTKVISSHSSKESDTSKVVKTAR